MGNVSDTTLNTDGHDSGWTYRDWRRSYYHRHFPTFWGTLEGEPREEYALYGALEVPRIHATALRTAATRLYQLMTRLAGALQRTEDRTLLDIGIPSTALSYARLVIPEMQPTMCGRFEFAMTREGPKLLEFNAETPTFVVESFQINRRVCLDFGLADPNEDSKEQLTQAIHDAISAGLHWLESPPQSAASVVFSAYADNLEEYGTADFLRSCSATRKNVPYTVSFQSLDTLRVRHDGLYSASGERIHVLYKLYPTEFLIEDEARDGTRVGLALMELVRKRALAIINPPAAFVLQNKALMALLWALHLVASELFTPEEHMWIEQYILPTYLDTRDAQGRPVFEGKHVVKPVYGREGDSVSLRQQQEVIEQSEQHLYGSQAMIYQQYAPLPTATLQTEEGLTEAYLVHNCFIVGGQPSAIGVRASRKLIFDDTSYFLPICHPRLNS